MSIKINTVETVVTYEVNDLSFYISYGMPTVITTDFIFKATADGTFLNLIQATEKKRYEACIAECLQYGAEITFEEFEKAVATVITNAQSKLAFIKEAMALEGLGALAE
jgi:hypothetical protein